MAGRNLFAEPAKPKGRNLFEQPMSTTEDVVRSAGAGARSGILEGITGMAGDVATAQGDIAAWIAGKVGASPETVETVRTVGRRANPFGGAPNSAEVQEYITDPLMGDALKHEPQTALGDYTKTAVEFAPAAVGNRASLLRRGAQVAIPAIASETAGQLTEDTWLEPWARAAAAVFGGGGVELTRGRGSTTAIARATEGATPQQLTEAEALFVQAQAQGTPITRLEAVQQVTSGGTRAGDLQRVVEGQGGLRDLRVISLVNGPHSLG